MENFLNDEVYAENSEEYEGYFLQNIKYRGRENDKTYGNMISKLEINTENESN